MRLSRRNVLLAIGGSASAGGALFGTQAFSTVTAERTAQVEVVGDGEALLVLEPVPGDKRSSNTDINPYASGKDGELSVDVTGNGRSSGVNPNAVTRIPEVFQIGNQGTQKVAVSIVPYDEGKENKIESVIFFRESTDAEAGKTENVGANKDVTISPGETAALVVGIDIVTTGEQPDVEDLAVIQIKASAQNEQQG